MNLWTNQNIKRYRKNDIYSLIISIMIFTKAANIRENLVEELLEIYEKWKNIVNTIYLM